MCQDRLLNMLRLSGASSVSVVLTAGDMGNMGRMQGLLKGTAELAVASSLPAHSLL